MSTQRSTAISRRDVLVVGLGVGTLFGPFGGTLAQVDDAGAKVGPHSYFEHLRRIIKGLRLVGVPLLAAHEKALAALAEAPTATGVIEAEAVLDEYTLLHVRLDNRGVGQCTVGAAHKELVEQGWRAFLIRVENPFALQQAITIASDAAVPEGELSDRTSLSTEVHRDLLTRLAEPKDVARAWLGYKIVTREPILRGLSGLALEYQILQLYSRDRGRRRAYLVVNGADAPRNRLEDKNGPQVEFFCLPSADVALGVKDWDGAGAVASFVICDEVGRLYPAPGHRLEPDLDFQPQVYRGDGETVRLPDGHYEIDVWRGPEYLKQTRSVVVGGRGAPTRLDFKLERWFNAAALGWYAGDTHIHAAGCAHYEVPTTGVTPETMIRHVRGEALAVGDVLTWSPGYYYQQRFFTGHVYRPTDTLGHPEFQAVNNTSLQPRVTAHDHESLVRYDIEVSGFPSGYSGHLVLLRLKDQDYKGLKRLANWPSWNLPILKWARQQGAVVGYAHCGAGLQVASDELPNYDLPAFEYVGANEFIVDVVHDAVDFVSAAELRPQTELDFWYHTLNCGFRTPMVGETDFPCFSDERVGTVRTYVGLTREPTGDEGCSAWVQGIKCGRVYFGHGRSHFIDYQINGHAIGGDDVHLSNPSIVGVSARVAAWLPEVPISADDDRLTPKYAYWHLERGRIARSRKVVIEVVVNGKAVNRILISYFPGEEVRFHTSTTAEELSIEILRDGYEPRTVHVVNGLPEGAISVRQIFTSKDAVGQSLTDGGCLVTFHQGFM